MTIRKLSAIALGALLGACTMGHVDDAEYGVARAKLVKGHFDPELMANHVVATDSSGEPTTTTVDDDAFQMPLAGGQSYRLSMIDQEGQEHTIVFHQQQDTEHYTEYMHINSESHGGMMGGTTVNMMGAMMSGQGMCCGYGTTDEDGGEATTETEEIPDDEETTEPEESTEPDEILERIETQSIDLGRIHRTEDGYLVPEHTPYAMMDTDGDGENDYVDVDDDDDGIVDSEDDDINGDGHADSAGMVINDDMPMESNHTDAGMQNTATGTGEPGTGMQGNDTPQDGMPQNGSQTDPAHQDAGVPAHDGGAPMMGESEQESEQSASPDDTGDDTNETPADDEAQGSNDVDHEPGDGPGMSGEDVHTDGGMPEGMPQGNQGGRS